MEKITSEILKKLKSIEVMINSSGDFVFDKSEIEDINLECVGLEEYLKGLSRIAIYIAEEGCRKSITKGVLTIKKSALNKTNNKGDVIFSQREDIAFVDGIQDKCDVYNLKLTYTDGNTENFYVPCEVLTDPTSDGHIDNIACASYEEDSSGNIKLLLGKKSKAETLIVNNYNDLVPGFETMMGAEIIEPLEIKIDNYFQIDENFYLEGVVKNESCMDKHIELLFLETAKLHITYDATEKKKKTSYLEMSRLNENYIFVAVGENVSFCCRAIKFISLDDDESGENYNDKETEQKAMLCLLTETEMKSFAYRHNAIQREMKREEVLQVFDYVLKGKISLNYFKYWLDIFKNFFDINTKDMHEAKLNDALQNVLIELYLDIYYHKTLEESREHIDCARQVLEEEYVK